MWKQTDTFNGHNKLSALDFIIPLIYQLLSFLLLFLSKRQSEIKLLNCSLLCSVSRFWHLKQCRLWHSKYTSSMILDVTWSSPMIKKPIFFLEAIITLYELSIHWIEINLLNNRPLIVVSIIVNIHINPAFTWAI